MRNISVIDCTLRDGGYLNNWQFDDKFQRFLIGALNMAKVENIELGFISQKNGTDEFGTYFRSIEHINEYLMKYRFNQKETKYFVMLRLGEYNPKNLPKCDKGANCVTGIRVMVAKDELKESINVLKEIRKKGYDVYIQPTVISSYDDEEVVKMLQVFSKVEYSGISIVDTFGSLSEETVKRYTMLFDKYARPEAQIGIHCHNNLGLAFINALAFMNMVTINRDIFVDTAVGGLGRGAGNLSTEDFITYLKREKDKDYVVFTLNDVSIRLVPAVERNVGIADYYAYALTAKKNMHPSYATYLVTNKYQRADIIKILENVAPEKYIVFDMAHIAKVCSDYKND